MNTILRAGVLIALIATAPPPANRFLLLDSRQLVEGEFELVGENYRVRRDGGETLFPAARVLALCHSSKFGPTAASWPLLLPRACCLWFPILPRGLPGSLP